MFLLVPAHSGCPRKNPESRKMVLCVCCANLYFKDDAGNGALHDVGSVKAVDAVGAKYAALFTDSATAVNPDNTTITTHW